MPPGEGAEAPNSPELVSTNELHEQLSDLLESERIEPPDDTCLATERTTRTYGTVRLSNYLDMAPAVDEGESIHDPGLKYSLNTGNRRSVLYISPNDKSIGSSYFILRPSDIETEDPDIGAFGLLIALESAGIDMNSGETIIINTSNAGKSYDEVSIEGFLSDQMIIEFLELEANSQVDD